MNYKMDYDKESDVLYCTDGTPATVGIEINEGDIVRINTETNSVVGITIVDFMDKLLKNSRNLEPEIQKLINEHFWELV